MAWIFYVFLQYVVLQFKFTITALRISLTLTNALHLFINGRHSTSIFEMVSDLIDDIIEELIQPFAKLRRHFKVGGVVLCCLKFSLLLGHLPIGKIYLVTHHYFDSIRYHMFFKQVVPSFEVVESGFSCHVVDHHCAIGILHVVRDETSESFGTCSVPELNSILMAVPREVFYMKVDADGGLNGH